MAMTMSARRRQAEDLQALLEGGRASSPSAAAELAPLVALAGAISPTGPAPGEDFRTALRDRLTAEARNRVPAPRRATAATLTSERVSGTRRARQAVAAVAVASVVAGVGAAAASTRALPGDTLYGLKRQVENVELALARGDVAQGRELLEQAAARLGEAESLVAGAGSTEAVTRTRVGQALTDMDTALASATDDLTRAYRETGDAEPLLLLDRFVTDQQDRLDDLRLLLDPALRSQVRALAARLAEISTTTRALLGGSADAGSVRPVGEYLRSGGLRPGRAGTDPMGPTRGATAAASSAAPAGGPARATAGTGGIGGSQGVDGIGGSVSGGGTAGTSGGAGVLGGAGPAATTPLPSPVPTVTVRVQVPAPTAQAPVPAPSPTVSSPVATVPVPPLPTGGALPSPDACVPLPPLTLC